MEGKRSTERDRETHRASQLDELLGCERELAEALSAARKEARGIVDHARADAAAAAAELEASLESETARERQRAREEARSRIEALSADAGDRATRFHDIGDEEVERLAGLAFRRLVAAGGDS